MNHIVKELFNAFYTDEERSKRSEPSRKRNHSRRIKVGSKPYQYFKIAPITDFTHFINCEISPNICPIQWEDLEIDFSSSDKRHCEHCDKFVYKVDNEFMVHKMQDENKCMAISNSLLEKMSGKMDEQQYENLQERLLFSTLFLVYKANHQEEFNKFVEKNFTQEQILKTIILDILNPHDIKDTVEWYADNGVDLETILHQILSNTDDEEFKLLLEEKILLLIKNQETKK